MKNGTTWAFSIGSRVHKSKRGYWKYIYNPPLGKSDYVLLEQTFIVAYNVIDEKIIKKTLNYKKGDQERTKKTF